MHETAEKIITEKTVEQIKQGDHTAFASLYAELADPYIRFLQRKFPVGIDHEGLFQDAMLSVWKYGQKIYGKNPEELKSWILSIVINKGYDEMRKQIRRPTSPLNPEHYKVRDEEDLESGIIAKTSVEELLSSVDGNDSSIQCFLDIKYKDLSYEEVARKYRIAMGTVKSRVSRGREKIYQKLDL